ncbi:Mitochondrial inner membrane protease subunit 1 [Frankliniella fusca]|uniref:Mitochondrial inner membrane protease subunit 1 n=1 Tax=Frankliniella fusca TaxID=407009 RepID=A0AAE1GYD5_9NEOP|nr:Mitochondrial inner membrane protease subunit 1 [Frankliniella fusca]
MKMKWKPALRVVARAVGIGCAIRVIHNEYFFLVKTNGPSMEPTFHTGDFIIGERRPKDVTYGNILILRSPFDPEGYLVKRLMGLPGDIKRNGLSFTKVPEGHMWLEGDNSSNSRDSRSFGPVPQGLITGRALYKVWPPSEAKVL